MRPFVSKVFYAVMLSPRHPKQSAFVQVSLLYRASHPAIGCNFIVDFYSSKQVLREVLARSEPK